MAPPHNLLLTWLSSDGSAATSAGVEKEAVPSSCTVTRGHEEDDDTLQAEEEKTA